jgi:acetolactate synthase-1/2/3 large subunit
VDPNLAQRVRAADLIVSIGSRLGENTTQAYTLLQPPLARQTLVHVHPDPNEIGRVYQPELGIPCTLSEFAQHLAHLRVPKNEARGRWLRELRADYEAFSTPPRAPVAGVDFAEVVTWLSDHLEDNAIIANGAGNYTVWVHRFFRYRQARTELAPVSGAMGYGVPAAIAASLRHPQRRVIAFAGDGCFLMYPQELGTAIQYGAKPIVILINNGLYGTIRMHQERRYPGRVVATKLRNPDFGQLAGSFGAHIERVEASGDFPAAYARAAAAGRAALIELKVDPAQLTPAYRLPAGCG